MRGLKYHEQKLLKRVNFLEYKRDTNIRELEVLRRYHITDRMDYQRYNRLVGKMASFASKVMELEYDDPLRVRMTELVLEKCYAMGLIPVKKNLKQVQKLTVSAFCRRRLPVVMTRLKFSETVKQAVTLIEQGHVRVGPNTVTDPAFVVTRDMEDLLTWVDASKIRRHVKKYNDDLDDFELMGA